MSVADRKWLRIGTLVALYVAQGIPWGFTATTLPAYIAAHGVTASALSDALVATTLPYSFKWILGLVVDTVRLPVLKGYGQRRPWIIFAQLMMALTIGMMLLTGNVSEDLSFLAQMVLVHTVFNALQDVATDGYAVTILEEHERGRVNGLLFAAKYGGGVIGGAGLGYVIAWSTLQVALVIQVVILLGIMLVPLLVRGDEKTVDAPARARDVLAGLAESLSTRKAFLLAFAFLTYTFGQAMLSGVSAALYTQQLGWEPEKLTALVGGWGLVAGLVGSLVGGAIADYVGHRRLAIIACVAAAAGWCVFALGESMWTNDWFAYATSIWEAFFIAVGVISLIALCMGAVSPKAASSQFAAYMALSNFSATLGYSVPGWIPEATSTKTFYLLAVGSQLFCAVLIALLVPWNRADAPAPSVRRGYLALGFLGCLLAGLTAFVVWNRFR